jgi:hypothetical protein
VSGLSVRDASGILVSVETVTLPSGNTGLVHVLSDANAAPYGPNNPLLTAPAIYPVQEVDRGGSITTAGTAQTAMASNGARKGGWVKADPGNQGVIYLSFTGAATITGGAGNQAILAPGASCPLIVNGYVIQAVVSVAGTAAGDHFSAVEFQ